MRYTIPWIVWFLFVVVVLHIGVVATHDILFDPGAKAFGAEITKPVQRLMIINQNQQEAANKACVRLFGPKAANTFSVVMEDTEKKKYYVCSWRLSDENTTKLKAELDKISGTKPKVLTRAKKDLGENEFIDARVKLKELDISKPKDASVRRDTE